MAWDAGFQGTMTDIYSVLPLRHWNKKAMSLPIGSQERGLLISIGKCILQPKIFIYSHFRIKCNKQCDRQTDHGTSGKHNVFADTVGWRMHENSWQISCECHTWLDRSDQLAVDWSWIVTDFTPPRTMFLAISTPSPPMPDTRTLDNAILFIAAWPNTYLSKTHRHTLEFKQSV